MGTWEGILTKENAVWARFYDRDGNLVLLPEEIAREERERANLAEEECDRERQRAENAETQQQNTQTALEEEQQKNQMLIDRPPQTIRDRS